MDFMTQKVNNVDFDSQAMRARTRRKKNEPTKRHRGIDIGTSNGLEGSFIAFDTKLKRKRTEEPTFFTFAIV